MSASIQKARPVVRWASQVATCLLVTGSLGIAIAQQPQHAHVTLAAGATLEQAVAELARAIDGVVVADVAVVDRTLQQDLKGVPLEEAVAAVSVDFDRFCLRRGRSLALLLRRTDLDEAPALDLEETEAIADDVFRLTGALLPNPSLFEYVEAKATFVRSTSPEQRAAMQGGGLPFAALSSEQQSLLINISARHKYGGTAQGFRRMGRHGRDLARTQLFARESPAAAGRDRHQWLAIRGTDPEDNGGSSEVQLHFSSERDVAKGLANAGKLRREALSAAGAVVEGEPRYEGVSVRISVREMTVSEFSSEWRRAIGSPLRVPEYAAERRFWICSQGATRTESAQALADLWGWESTTLAEVRRLGRRIAPEAADAVQMHHSLNDVFPLSVRFAVRTQQRGMDGRRRRQALAPIFAAIEHEVGVDQPLQFEKLSAAHQQQVANALVESAAIAWLLPDGSSPPLPSYLAEPQSIVLKLSGPPAQREGDPAPKLSVNAKTGGWNFVARTFPKLTLIESPAQQ